MVLSELTPLQIGFDAISADASLLASISIILGAVFVVVEIRDNKKLVEASLKQANAASDQSRLTTLQLKQNYELATVNLVTEIYDVANSMEVQRSWKTVLDTSLSSFDDYERLPEDKQLAYMQMASLFEAVGLLVEKHFVNAELVDDMFATALAWAKLRPFVYGMRQRHAAEDYYFWFEKLYERLSKLDSRSTSSPSVLGRDSIPRLTHSG